MWSTRVTKHLAIGQQMTITLADISNEVSTDITVGRDISLASTLSVQIHYFFR